MFPSFPRSAWGRLSLPALLFLSFPRSAWERLSLLAPVLAVLAIILTPQTTQADPNQLGQTGLVNMPDARIAPEGTLRVGVSYMDPYGALWSSVSFFNWLELSGRYTRINNVEAFKNRPDANYGDYKDKAFDAKLRLLPETEYLPQVSIGAQDFFGTQVFDANFLTFSKHLGDIDITLGTGTDRIDGAFGGLRYNPDYLPNWSFVAEYDAFDYPNEFQADASGAYQREGGATLGVNYRWGWLGTQLSWQQGDEWGLLGYIAIPMNKREFVPKLDEPKPYTRTIQRPTLAQWQADPQYANHLIRALQTQDYKNVRVWLNGTELELGVSSARITLMGRAVGRAVRTALLMSPIGTESIRVTYYTLKDLPVLSYRFKDLDKLDKFFSGQLTYGELIKTMSVKYADPAYTGQLQANQMIPSPAQQAQAAQDDELQITQNKDGHILALHKSDDALSGYQIVPINLGIFFNDPSGAFKYDWFITGDYQHYLGDAWFINAGARASVLEDVSDVTQPSNSLLPHVRSDVAHYKRERGLKIDNLLVNKYLLLQPRVYGRLSAGLYEEMFGGAGGQILYLPKDQNWAIDLAVDWLKQRDYGGDFKFLDYDTTTAIASIHYRVKDYGLNFTLRAGKFLAKDNGARLEISRRFLSGIKVGAWYTYTNAEDTTGPGTPSDPYQDKGVFLQIPLNTMLTRDTKSTVNMSIRPWTRDGGQMVTSPGDLYEIFDRSLMLDRPEYHLLSGFHE